MTGRVYFLSCANRIKIGFSKNVPARMRQLATGSAVKFDLICDVAGSKAFERCVHARLADYREHGEWFKDCAAVRSLIKSIERHGYAAVGFVDAPEPNHAPVVARTVETPKLPDAPENPLLEVYARINACMVKYVGENVRRLRVQERQQGLSPGKLINPTIGGHWTAARAVQAFSMLKTTAATMDLIVGDVLEACLDDEGQDIRAESAGLICAQNLEDGLAQLFSSADISLTDVTGFSWPETTAEAA